MGGREVSRPYRVWFFAVKRRAVFIKVDSPRKRVVEGLCGWRHGNSFPMTQSAQSHRQMRSIPFCSKAVFLCFLFPCPQYLSTEPKKWAAFPFGGNAAVVCFKSRFWGLSVGWCACYFATFTAVPLERRKM